MTMPPGPTPPATKPATLDGVVTAVHQDPPAAAVAIRGRISASHDEGNVCMMGGWTS